MAQVVTSLVLVPSVSLAIDDQGRVSFATVTATETQLITLTDSPPPATTPAPTPTTTTTTPDPVTSSSVQSSVSSSVSTALATTASVVSTTAVSAMSLLGTPVPFDSIYLTNPTARPTGGLLPPIQDPTNKNPAVPAVYDINALGWLNSYMLVHQQSFASYRYIYIFWIIIGSVFAIVATLHLLGTRYGYLGAIWTKWALRKRTWRKKHTLAVARRTGQKHKQPFGFPSNAQLLALTSLFVLTILLCEIGPDYIAPRFGVFDTSSAATSSLVRKEFIPGLFPEIAVQYRPNYTIPKSWWTQGNRTGEFAYALMPLVILFAVKAPPFAIFALPCFTQLHFDKLVRLHRWVGRLLWFITMIHVIQWAVQLNLDKYPGTTTPLWHWGFQYEKFVYGWAGFLLLTALTLFSLHPVRNAFYDYFWVGHILLAPAMIIMAALHHPPIWGWCWIALGLWLGERAYRGVRFAYVNGYMGGMSRQSVMKRMTAKSFDDQASSVTAIMAGPQGMDKETLLEAGSPAPPIYSNRFSNASTLSFSGKGLEEIGAATAATCDAYLPPPGYAHCQLLPGRTVRVRLVTPGYISWAPGQHFLIGFPCISEWATHPFTIASISDDISPSQRDREIVMLIRAKGGWTKRLWDEVASLITHGQHKYEAEHLAAGFEAPTHGVVLRARVDGPFGSSVRADWGTYDTCLIVCGGSGISYGMSVVQYICMCMSGRDGRTLGAQGKFGYFGGKKQFKTRKVRLVWLLREYSHLQWCASQIRRCLDLIPDREMLEISIYVSNTKSLPERPPPMMMDEKMMEAPPRPQFVREGSTFSHDGGDSDHEELYNPHRVSSDMASIFSHDNLSTANFGDDGYESDQHHELDFTNFDGDDDTAIPGEERFAELVKKEGKIRRANTRARAKKAGHARGSSLGGPIGEEGRTSTGDSLLVPPTIGRRPSAPDALYSVPSAATSAVSVDTTAPDTHKRLSSAASFVLAEESGKKKGRLSALFGGSVGFDDLTPGQLSGEMGDKEKDKKKKGVQIDIDDFELRDIEIVSECARAGKPKLDMILKEEVNKAKGAIAIGFCGPAALNAALRKAASNLISPEKIRKGDYSGHITLFSEEFEY